MFSNINFTDRYNDIKRFFASGTAVQDFFVYFKWALLISSTLFVNFISIASPIILPYILLSISFIVATILPPIVRLVADKIFNIDLEPVLLKPNDAAHTRFLKTILYILSFIAIILQVLFSIYALFMLKALSLGFLIYFTAIVLLALPSLINYVRVKNQHINNDGAKQDNENKYFSLLYDLLSNPKLKSLYFATLSAALTAVSLFFVIKILQRYLISAAWSLTIISPTIILIVLFAVYVLTNNNRNNSSNNITATNIYTTLIYSLPINFAVVCIFNIFHLATIASISLPLSTTVSIAVPPILFINIIVVLFCIEAFLIDNPNVPSDERNNIENSDNVTISSSELNEKTTELSEDLELKSADEDNDYQSKPC